MTHIGGKNALVSFIVPSVVYSNLSYTKLRDLILDNGYLREARYTGGKVFKSVTVDTTILVMDKSTADSITLTNAVNFKEPDSRTVRADYFAAAHNVISVGTGADEIAERLLDPALRPLEADYTVFQGIVTGNNDAFIFDTEEAALAAGVDKELLRPLCHGRDVGRYAIRPLRQRRRRHGVVRRRAQRL